jgi:putative transposase
LQNRLYEYIGGIIRAQNGHLIEIGGVEDHVHLLANLAPTKAVSDSIREIKANASKWSNELFDQRSRFEWQKGYGAFSVSYSQIESIRHYIQNQLNTDIYLRLNIMADFCRRYHGFVFN